MHLPASPSVQDQSRAGAASRRARIWRRTRVGASLTIALALLFALVFATRDGRIVQVASALVLLLACHELARMGRFAELRLGLPLGAAALAEIALGWSGPRFAPGDLGGLALAVLRPALVALAADGVQRIARGAAPGPVRGRARIAWIAGLAPAIALPLTALFEIWNGYGARGLLALVALSKIGDIAGYYVGGAIGRSHPFPRISPGKTTAGCVASLIAGTISGALFAHFGLLPEARLGLLTGPLAGALVNLGAQAGDLAESALKRWAGVKDSSTRFGPSGGVLDLVDSLLLSVPVALLTWPLLLDPS